MTKPNQTLEALRGKLLAISDQVYVPNETKDYTGVKIGVDINEAVALFQEYAQSMVVEELERLIPKIKSSVSGNWNTQPESMIQTLYAHELACEPLLERITAIKSQGSKEE